MSEYRNRTTGEVKTQGQWRNEFANMSLPRVWKAATLDALDLDPKSFNDLEGFAANTYSRELEESTVVLQALRAEGRRSL